MWSRDRSRRIRLRDGREVTVRPIGVDDKAGIVAAFERLSADSRYRRFMRHKKTLDEAALERGVHPRPGQDCAIVATVSAAPRTPLPTSASVPASASISTSASTSTRAAPAVDIVGAAQYVRVDDGDPHTCEFAITVAEDWRGSGLANRLMARLVRRARRDGYTTMEGWVLADNAPMLALARRFRFLIEPAPGAPGVMRVRRAL